MFLEIPKKPEPEIVPEEIVETRAELEEEQKIPRMVSISKAAELTGLSYTVLRRWCLEDRIIYVKAGSHFLINLDRLIDYLNGKDLREAPAEPEPENAVMQLPKRAEAVKPVRQQKIRRYV